MQGTRRNRASHQLVVLTPYAVLPPRHGGPIRVAGILGHLGDDWTITHFSQAPQRVDFPWPPARRHGSDHWEEVKLRDPVSWAWLMGLSKLGGYPAAYADRLLALRPRPRIVAAMRSADVVLVSPHYQFFWAKRHAAATPIVVDQHNVETEVWPARRAGWTRRVALEIQAGERRAWREADALLATCERDAEIIRRGGGRRVEVVPNGVDVNRFRPLRSEEERHEARRRLNIRRDATVAVFVGGGGYANRQAVDVLESQVEAYRREGVDVVVVGRVGIHRRDRPGLTFTGEVDDVPAWLSAADIAVCPLLEGGGTSLKTVEYFAAGVAVVSTPVGVRNLGATSGRNAVVTSVEDMPTRVGELARNAAKRAALGREARRLAVEQYSWQASGARTAALLGEVASGARADRRHRATVR